MRDGTDIEMSLSFTTQVQIVLAKYSIEGAWLGLEELTTQVRARGRKLRGGPEREIPLGVVSCKGEV